MQLERGDATSTDANVEYRLGKLRAQGVLHGVWLDCGCAEGGYAVPMLESGAKRVIGIDIEPDRVLEAHVRAFSKPREVSRSESECLALSYCCASCEALPMKSDFFDGVFMNEVLEHVEDEATALAEIARVLKPGGVLVLISPNRWFPFEGHGARILGKSLPFPVPFLPWVPSRFTKGAVSARNYWPGELRERVRAAGLDVVASGSVLPVFERYRWLPTRIIEWYRSAIPAIERTPVTRRFGVSTMVVGQKLVQDSR